MAYEDPNDPMFGRSGTGAMSEPDVGRDGLQDAENLESKKRQQKSREEGRRRRQLRRERREELNKATSASERREIKDQYERQEQGVITDISTEDVEQDDNLQSSNSRVGDDSIDTVDEPVISNTITLDVVLSDNTAGTQEFFIP
jgi:hypothetical protein